MVAGDGIGRRMSVVELRLAPIKPGDRFGHPEGEAAQSLDRHCRVQIPTQPPKKFN